MQDYPVDKNNSMSQVFHAEKMLLELPPEQGPPAVRVDHELFFIHELVQLRSGEYFIPERYFRAPTHARPDVLPKTLQDLFALGWRVTETNVCSLVIPKL